MKRNQLFLVFALALIGAFAGMMIFTHVNEQATVFAQGKSQFAPHPFEFAALLIPEDLLNIRCILQNHSRNNLEPDSRQECCVLVRQSQDI